MRANYNKLVFVLLLLYKTHLILSDEYASNSDLRDKYKSNGRKAHFTPRMDYNQWKPLGRADPLKNDPTYDYVPPVLDRVHYWVEPDMREPDSSVPGENKKSEILLLGITSKKPASSGIQAESRKDSHDSFTKYVDALKYNSNQRIGRPTFNSPIPTSFFPSIFGQNVNKHSDRAAFSKGDEQRVPYTMLMPPPLVKSMNPARILPNNPSLPEPQSLAVFQNSLDATTSRSTVIESAPSVSIQPSNIIYQSSGIVTGNEFGNNQHQTLSTSISWEEPTTSRIIPDFRDALVYRTNLAPPESYMQIEFSQNNFSNKPLIAADSNHNINYVTPPPLLEPEKEVMFKGQVSDDNLDISNTYVKIGKPEAEVHSSGIGISKVEIDTDVHRTKSLVPTKLVMFSSMNLPEIKGDMLNMQTLQDMQTMHPPPVTQSPVFSTNMTDTVSTEKEPPITKNPSTISQLHTTTLEVENSKTAAAKIATKELTTSVPIPSTTSTDRSTVETTTTITSLTTDPLFKHYNQPVKLLKGPLYLIIEGHSKVKTYSPSKQVHGIKVSETNEISDNDDVRYDKEVNVKHLHGFSVGNLVEEASRKGRADNIQTLKHVVQTGLGAIDLTSIEDHMERRKDDVKETEFEASYKVVDGIDVTTPIYHRGIVETARKMS